MHIRLTIKKLAVELLCISITASFFFPARRLLFSVFMGSIGRRTTIHGYVRFFDIGKCSIGNNSTVNRWCFIDNRAPVTIGSNVNISHDVRIYTMGHDLNDPLARTVSRSVTIEDYAWIFPGARIMPGVTIGRGAVVYPGSIVTKSVPEYMIVAGCPATIISERSREISYTANFPVHFAI